MKIPQRFNYFFSPPPLWIVQIGNDELIFSQITQHGIGDQERLYIEAHTTLPGKIANPSSLTRGLQLFCTQKKLARFRAWFLLPKSCFPLPLLAHELFQFLLSIKSAPVIPEAIITNPFDKPTNLNTSAIKTIVNADNYLTMFDRYNKLHPAWWGLSLIFLLAATMAVFAKMYTPVNTPSKYPIHKILPPRQHPIKPHISKNSLPNIADSAAILTTIATIIPPSIVLNKFSLEKLAQKRNASPLTTLTGTTCNLQDLLEFVTLLEQQTTKHCNLSYIKELSGTETGSSNSQFSFYNFSLSLE